jgi:hypothetical protein
MSAALIVWVLLGAAAVAAQSAPSNTTTLEAMTTATTTTTAPSPTVEDTNCDTKYRFAGPSTSPSFNVDSINAILNTHNDMRRAVDPWASEMPLLTWDVRLQESAQEFVNTCPDWFSSSTAMRNNATRFGVPYVGELSFIGSSGGVNDGGFIAPWGAQKRSWSYPNFCKSGQSCDVYKTIIWASTLRVGCAYKYCRYDRYPHSYVCHYAPGADRSISTAPYVQATSTQVAKCQYGADTTTTPHTAVPPPTAPSATTPAPSPPSTSLGFVSPSSTASSTPLLGIAVASIFLLLVAA